MEPLERGLRAGDNENHKMSRIYKSSDAPWRAQSQLYTASSVKNPHRLLLFSFWTLEEVLEPAPGDLAAAVIGQWGKGGI